MQRVHRGIVDEVLNGHADVGSIATDELESMAQEGEADYMWQELDPIRGTRTDEDSCPCWQL